MSKKGKVALLGVAIFVVIAAIVIGVTLALVYDKHNNHTFVENPTQDCLASSATCTSGAVYYKSCKCGEISTETFVYGEPLGHTYGAWIEGQEPTCTEEGVKAHYHCSRCGKDYDVNDVEIADTTLKVRHQFGDWIDEIAATDSTDGVKGHKDCELCHRHFSASEEELKEKDLIITSGSHVHDYKKIIDADYLVSAATCTESAVYYKSCCYCGEASTETFEYGTALGHSYTNVSYVWNEAHTSCTATRTCGKCSYPETANGTVTPSVTQHLTCTANEITTYTATFDKDWCATQTETVTTAYAPGHRFGDVQYMWDATHASCVAIRTCLDDSNHVEVATSTNVSSEKTQNLTCTQDEITTYTATFDKEWCEAQTAIETTATATGHTFEEEVKVDALASRATCTTPAKYYKTCSSCGAKSTETFEHGTALGHDYEYTSVSGNQHKVTCTRCDYESTEACSDADKDHECDVCEAAMGTHEAAAGKHTCDYCGKKVTDCADENKDHKCDVCGNTLTVCVDENSDGKCDVCGTDLSSGSGTTTHTCADTNKDHVCDVCGKILSVCEDDNKDHKCDVCGKVLSVCEDTDNNGTCDVCGKDLSTSSGSTATHTCVDSNNDHVCDTCGKILSVCADGNKDHNCDVCGKKLSDHLDADKDHECDVCEAAMGTHEAAAGKHSCDYCGKKASECADENKDHKCDVCGNTLSICKDDNSDGKCDICGTDLSSGSGSTSHTCADANKDHTCDECGKILSVCEDDNKDHKCDVCGKVLSVCEDTDNNGTCDVCGKDLSSSSGSTATHTCVDGNNDHVCDTCGKILSVCADGNSDHNCDVCGKKLSDHVGGTATCTDKAVCTVCGEPYGEALGHSASDEWSTDGSEHWHVCTRTDCEEKLDKATHFGGTATCKDKAVCTVCGEPYGDYAEHIYGDWIAEIPAEEGKEGTKGHYHCSVCEKNFNDEYTEIKNLTIPAKDHVHSYTLQDASDDYLATAATCTAKATYYYSCSCGEHNEKTFEYGDPLGHDWGEVTYEWNDGLTSCTAKRVCKRCSEEESVDTNSITHEETTTATCVVKQVTTYTATFTGYDWLTTTTKDVEGDVDTENGHSYGDWKSNGDDTHSHTCTREGCSESVENHTVTDDCSGGDAATCTQKSVCDVCNEEYGEYGEHNYAYTAAKDANCTEDGNYEYYYCSVCDKYFDASESETPLKDLTIDALGHTYTESDWIAEIPATCTSTGTKGHYHCDRCDKDFDKSGNVIEDLTIAIDANNHDFEGVTVTYAWADDGSVCTATRVCKRNSAHAQTVSATKIDSSITQEQTCTDDQKTTYTATFEGYDWCTTQTKVVTTADALGHDWNDVTYTWNDDYTSCTAKRTCKRCSDEETATTENIKHEVTTTATCVVKQVITYTATFSGYDWLTTTTKDVEGDVDTENGHSYGDWKSNGDGTHSKTCSLCTEDTANHAVTEDCTSGETCTVCGESTLAFSLLDNGTYAVSGIGAYSGTELVIPSTYNGKAVTAIADDAFNAYDESSASTASTYALSLYSSTDTVIDRLKALTSVTIPGSVESVGFNAFLNCSSLTSATISNGVKTFDCGVFNGTALTSVVVPDSVTTIGEGAFACDSLEEITLPFVGETASTYTYLGHIFGATQLSESAEFVPTSLKTVTITKATEIAENAFYGCSNITTINLPSTLTYVGESAFLECTGLIKANYTGTVDQWVRIGFENKESTPTFYAKDLYINDVLLTKANLNVAALNYAFTNCASLTEVTLSNKQLTIPYMSFMGTGISTITIPSSVTEIDRFAFANCPNLTSLVIPDSVTKMKNAIVQGSDVIEELTIPFVGASFVGKDEDDNITSTDNSAFATIFTDDLTKLQMRVPASLKTVTITGGTTIAENAFSGCKYIEEIVLPNSVTSIDKYAFDCCAALTSVNIPNGVTTIDEGTFNTCSGLQRIVIPSGVTTIGVSAFYKCTSLANVDMSACDELTSIRANAFYQCSGLKGVTIPDSVTTIGNTAFYGCSKLESIYITDIASWCAIAGLDNLMIYGSSSKSLYLNGEKITNLVIPEGVTSIGSYAFYGYSGITSVTIGNSVTSIGDKAFINCGGLKTVYYGGTASEWIALTTGSNFGSYNTNLTSATVYYYSATQATGCWRYVDGVPTLW